MGGLAGYDLLVFFVAAGLGFGAWALGGWESYPAWRIREILTPRRVWIILSVAFAALIGVACVSAVAALPGETLYIVKILLRSFGAQAFLGFAFGLGFGIWVGHFFVPNALAGAHTRAVHLRWGIGLLVLFLTGVLMGPGSRLLPHLTGISTPVVSLDFAGSDQKKPERGVDVSAGNGPGGQVSSGKDSSGRSSDVARSYLSWPHVYLKRDSDYARLLHGKPSDELKALQKRALTSLTPIARCFAIEIENKKYWEDPGAIHTEFGRALAAHAAWLRSVLVVEGKDGGRISGMAPTEMYPHLPGCPHLQGSGFFYPLSSEAYELPYLTLAIAHMMQLSGYRRAGAELLAQWIDRSLQKDLMRKIPDWYRIRAYLHLSVLVEDEGDALTTHDVLRKNVRLLERTLSESPDYKLRHWSRWAKNCLKRPKSIKSIRPPLREETEDEKSIGRIHFTFMSESSRWIRQALYSGQVTADLLPYAKHVTAVSETCYPRLPSGPVRKRAEFLTTHGGLLAALAARGYFIAPEGGKDLQTYRDARAYLLQALALLQPLERLERTQHLNTTVAAAIGPHPVRQEVIEAEGYLGHTERALNIR